MFGRIPIILATGLAAGLPTAGRARAQPGPSTGARTGQPAGAPPAAAPKAAQRPARPPPYGKTVVMVATTADATEIRELRQAVGSQLVDTPASLKTVFLDRFPADLSRRLALARNLAGQHRAVAVFWYERPGPGEHYLYVVDPRGGRVLVRTVDPTASTGGSETVANIVRASVQALLAGGSIGVRMPAKVLAEPRTGPPKPPEPVPFGRIRRRSAGPASRRLAVELAYAFQAYATAKPALNGMWAGLSVHLHRNWSVSAGYHLYEPVKISGTFAYSRFQRHPATAGARFRWPAGRWEVGCSASVILDYITHRTREAEPGDVGVTSSGRTYDLVVGGAALFRIGFWIIDRLGIVGQAGVEFTFNNKRYVVGGEYFSTEVLLAPWPVRPRLELGLQADLF